MSYDSKTCPQLWNNVSQCFQWFPHFKNWNLRKFQIFETKVHVVNMDQIKPPMYIYMKCKYQKWIHILHLELRKIQG
jgi:hypothetical protein